VAVRYECRSFPHYCRFSDHLNNLALVFRPLPLTRTAPNRQVKVDLLVHRARLNGGGGHLKWSHKTPDRKQQGPADFTLVLLER